MTKLTTDEARQASTGNHARWILGASIALATIALAVTLGLSLV